MIELEIPKDIRRYEAKLFGPFTTRQLICFAIASVIAFAVYSLLKEQITNIDVLICIIIILDLPFILCGWVKPYGMHFEQFASVAFGTTFLSPTARKYVIENPYSDKLAEDKKEKDTREKRAKNQKKSKDKALKAYK